MLWHICRKHNGLKSHRGQKKLNVYTFTLSRAAHIQHDASVKVLLKNNSVKEKFQCCMKVIIFIDFIMLALSMTGRYATLPFQWRGLNVLTPPPLSIFQSNPLHPPPELSYRNLDLFIFQFCIPDSLVMQRVRKMSHLLSMILLLLSLQIAPMETNGVCLHQ